MKNDLVRLLSVVSLCGALSALPSCAAYVEPDGSIEVATEPPPPQVEVVPVAPYPGAVWVGGAWEWRSGRHVWVGGRYVRPRAGYTYQQHTWVRAPSGGWRHTPGGWRRH